MPAFSGTDQAAFLARPCLTEKLLLHWRNAIFQPLARRRFATHGKRLPQVFNNAPLGSYWAPRSKVSMQ
jgi:hypothetical protein